MSSKERLYIGSGAGVQSSYATILMVLRYTRFNSGSRFIDLGSGFGRVGLVIGLLYPEVKFSGFEFVQERVDMANKTSQLLGIDSNTKFFVQDLSYDLSL